MLARTGAFAVRIRTAVREDEIQVDHVTGPGRARRLGRASSPGDTKAAVN